MSEFYQSLGGPGLNGPDGGRGPDGGPGVSGIMGATGPAPDGPTGPRGDDGETGITGADGPTGNQGTNGGPGPTGADGDPTKLAVLPSSGGPVSLYCKEAPEVLIEDFYKVRLCNTVTLVPIDPRFLEVVEEFFVSSYVTSIPATVQVSVLRNFISIQTSPSCRCDFNVTLCGVRRGFVARRFLPHTTLSMQHNNAFWSRA